MSTARWCIWTNRVIRGIGVVWLMVLPLGMMLQAQQEEMVKQLCIAKFNAMVHRDTAALWPMLHPRLVYIHSSGKTDSRESLYRTVVNETTKYMRLEVDSAIVRQFGPTVVIHGRLQYAADSGGGVKAYPLLFTEVWQRTGKRWQLISRHANRLP